MGDSKKLKKSFPDFHWGSLVAVHEIDPYQIVEYHPEISRVIEELVSMSLFGWRSTSTSMARTKV